MDKLGPIKLNNEKVLSFSDYKRITKFITLYADPNFVKCLRQITYCRREALTKQNLDHWNALAQLTFSNQERITDEIVSLVYEHFNID
jgi:hypothetical protein